MRAVGRHKLLAQAPGGRGVVNQCSVLVPPVLEPAAVAALVEQLRAVSGVGRAYLMRKRVVHMPEHPLYVLGLEENKRARGKVDIAEIRDYAASNMDFPGECFVVSLNWYNRRFRRTMKRTRDALIYDRAAGPQHR